MAATIPNSVPTTMHVAECPICDTLTPQMKMWSYQTVIGQYCFDCLHLMFNNTVYSATTKKVQKVLYQLALEQQGKGLVTTLTGLPEGIDTLWPYYEPGTAREGFKLLK